MTATEVAEFLASYAKLIEAPIVCGSEVTSVRWADDGYAVRTDEGEWSCATVVLASGAFNVHFGLPSDCEQT